MEIIRASEEHVEQVSRLFDLYRQFYQCEPDLEMARQYIRDRIRFGESAIFVSMGSDLAARGFVQLYPSFCSIDAKKIMILYDLFVDPRWRKHGTGEALMNKATEYAKKSGASRIDLLTAMTNKPGQALYEKLGYRIVLEDFHAYSLQI